MTDVEHLELGNPLAEQDQIKIGAQLATFWGRRKNRFPEFASELECLA
ncbi:hypothetical protein [Williamsia sp. D3]|nr:hypothetical protein [Williamsia sp. D3]